MGFATIGAALGASAANAAAVGAAVVSTTTALAGTAASLSSQANTAKAQAEHQNKINENITKATIDNYKEITKAEQNVLYNAAQDTISNKIGQLRAESEAEAVASATGHRGRSSDMLMANLGLMGSQQQQSITMARDAQLENLNLQAKQLQTGAEQSFINTPIAKPSPWEALATGVNMGAQVHSFGSRIDSSITNSRKVGGI